MAMACVNGARECDGCGRCWETGHGETVGTCPQCGQAVLSCNDRYELPDGEIVHDDCLADYAREHYYRAGT